jgi:hypothetical protein
MVENERIPHLLPENPLAPRCFRLQQTEGYERRQEKEGKARGFRGCDAHGLAEEAQVHRR